MQNDPLRYFRYAAHNRVISALAITSLVLGVSGCDNAIKNNRTGAVTGMVTPNQSAINHQAPPIEVMTTVATPEGIKEVITANNQFAFDMYQQINGQPDQAAKNVFFSPYSLSTAMAMLYTAAEGETKAQIQKTFHYPTPTTLNPNSAALYNQFNKPNPDYKLATVNDLWMQQGLTPTKSYIDTVQRYYSGQVTALDFEGSPDPARQTINKKIAEKTKQMIPELLPKGSIKSDTAVVLTNAVYF